MKTYIIFQKEREKQMAVILDGKLLAQKIRQNVKVDVQILKEKGIYPKLAVIMVGDDRGFTNIC